MNKQILSRISLIILPLLIIGISVYLFINSNVKEAKASVNIAGDRSEFDLFKSYNTWPNSATRKTGTAAEWLHTMVNDVAQGSAVTHVDINGDGLVDILLHQEKVNIEGSLYHWYYGVLLNRGDLTFDLVYKCLQSLDSGVSRFYGDCAAL